MELYYLLQPMKVAHNRRWVTYKSEANPYTAVVQPSRQQSVAAKQLASIHQRQWAGQQLVLSSSDRMAAQNLQESRLSHSRKSAVVDSG